MFEVRFGWVASGCFKVCCVDLCYVMLGWVGFVDVVLCWVILGYHRLVCFMLGNIGLF